MEKLKRQLRGYHYKNNFVTIPIVEYFTLGNKENLLEAFDLLNSVLDNYTLDDRYRYGFPAKIYSASYQQVKILSPKRNVTHMPWSGSWI